MGTAQRRLMATMATVTRACGARGWQARRACRHLQSVPTFAAIAVGAIMCPSRWLVMIVVGITAALSRNCTLMWATFKAALFHHGSRGSAGAGQCGHGQNERLGGISPQLYEASARRPGNAVTASLTGPARSQAASPLLRLARHAAAPALGAPLLATLVWPTIARGTHAAIWTIYVGRPRMPHTALKPQTGLCPHSFQPRLLDRNLADFFSSQVRALPPPLQLAARAASGRSRPRIGLLTVCVGKAMGCGLVQWCQGAQRLQSVLRHLGWSADILIITSDDASDAEDAKSANVTGKAGEQQHASATEDCPGATSLRVPTDLAAALDGCRERWRTERASIIAGLASHHVDQRPTLLRHIRPSQLRRNFYKWTPFKLTEYDAILLADVDIDLLPHEQQTRQIAQAWRTGLPQLLARDSSVHVVGTPDSSAPLNNGMLLVRPSRALYDDGLAVLQTCHFNDSHGWDHIGRPQELSLEQRHLDGTLAYQPGNTELFSWKKKKFFARNDWGFTDAKAGQGFFFYMLCVRHRVCRSARYLQNPRHMAMHWMGGGSKPWEVPKGGLRNAPIRTLATMRDYLSRTSVINAIGPRSTPCLRRLWALQRRIEQHPRYQATYASTGAFIPNPIIPVF